MLSLYLFTPVQFYNGFIQLVVSVATIYLFNSAPFYYDSVHIRCTGMMSHTIRVTILLPIAYIVQKQ